MGMIVVMFSGGITSFEVLRRVQLSGQAFRVLFADTTIEDEDNYRFMRDAQRVLGVTIETITDGRNIWEVFRDERFIGNTRIDVCSKILKRKPCLRWLKENEPGATVALGLDWTEPHRIKRAASRWKSDGFGVLFPLAHKPYMLKADYMAEARKLGIEPPRMYALGFEHANCGGCCVKGGQAQWALARRTFPERFAWHAEQEQITRDLIGQDVTVLKDRAGGDTKPLTLTEFSRRGGEPKDDLFSCTCMEE